ncbi:MAG: hypothetical protein Q9192_007712 [Flavoplaca navasiana]
MATQIEDFSGLKNKDAKLFVKTVKLCFLNVKFSTDAAEDRKKCEDALCMTLIMHTRDTRRNTLRDLAQLNQRDSKLKDYFEKMRDIKQHMSDKFDSDITDAMMNGLRDKVIRATVSSTVE